MSGLLTLLPPKLTDQFAVMFSAAINTAGATPEGFKAALLVLSEQLVECQLPEQVLGRSAPPNGSVSGFKHLNTQGNAVFVFQDDLSNQIQEGIDYLADADPRTVSALVMKLDRNKTVLEAYYLNYLKLLTVQHSPLTYLCTGASGNKIVTKTLTTTAEYVQRAVYNQSTGYPTVAEFIGKF